jgi:hypothetical protein
MKMSDVNYSVEFIKTDNKVIFKGNLRLQSVEEYNEIMDFVFNCAINSETILLIDMTQLSVINSSGIASLGLFLIKMRDYQKKIKILASKYVHWQSVSLKDFKEINEDVEIEYVVHH